MSLGNLLALKNNSQLNDLTNQVKKIVVLTQAQYDALATKDSLTLYLISG